MGTGEREGPSVTAYVLVADPSYLRESLLSYYDRVERIVLSYDETGTSWTGTPLPLDQCLRIVGELDVDGKCVHAPGRFARLDHAPMENETHQRQAALDLASQGADWVLQLDSDEVLLSADAFFSVLEDADRAGAGGLDYPSRWLYARAGAGRYLEASGRFWQPAASYPGPVAVRAGTRLRHARQADVELFRADLRSRNTDPWRAMDAPVHRVVAQNEAIAHFSWVRDVEIIRRKFGWSGHTEDLRGPVPYRRWIRRTRHPVATAVLSPLRRGSAGWFRLSRIPEPPGGVPITVDFPRDG